MTDVAPIPPFDEDRLAELVSALDADELGVVLSLFLEEVAAEVQAISGGLDDETHEKATHFVRSGALNLGLAALAHEAAVATSCPPAQRPAAGSALARAWRRTADAVAARWPDG